MKKKCERRCEILPEIPSELAKIFFITGHSLMLEKIKNFLHKLGLEVETIEDGLLVESPNPKETLRRLLSEVAFSEVEPEDVSLVFMKSSETPSFNHFKSMKPLLTWREILDAEDYLDLL